MNRNLDSLGRLVIPKEMRDALGLKNGEEANIKIVNDEIIITNPKKVDNFRDWLNNKIEKEKSAVYTCTLLKEVLEAYINLK